MLSLITQWFAHVFLGATALLALNPLATTTPSTLDVTPATAEEISQSLHDKITDLRAEVERAHLDASLPLTRPLSLGLKGNDVLTLQNLLVSLDFLTSDLVTGYYGQATQTAITGFQKAYLLPVTGAVDRNTLDNLFALTIHNLDLGNTYFPEETQLLTIATSSEAIKEETDSANAETSAVPVELTAPPTVHNITLTGSNYAFSPNSLVVRAGDILVIHLAVTTGTHNFTLPDFNVKSINVGSNKSADFNFAATAPGTYLFYSSVSNDKSQGMTGTLTVTAP